MKIQEVIWPKRKHVKSLSLFYSVLKLSGYLCLFLAMLAMPLFWQEVGNKKNYSSLCTDGIWYVLLLLDHPCYMRANRMLLNIGWFD